MERRFRVIDAPTEDRVAKEPPQTPGPGRDNSDELSDVGTRGLADEGCCSLPPHPMRCLCVKYAK